MEKRGEATPDNQVSRTDPDALNGHKRKGAGIVG